MLTLRQLIKQILTNNGVQDSKYHDHPKVWLPTIVHLVLQQFFCLISSNLIKVTISPFDCRSAFFVARFMAPAV